MRKVEGRRWIEGRQERKNEGVGWWDAKSPHIYEMRDAEFSDEFSKEFFVREEKSYDVWNGWLEMVKHGDGKRDDL